MFIFRGQWYHGDVFQDSTQFWTIDEASEATGFHPNYLRRLLRRGTIKGQKVSIIWLVERESLLEYIRQGEQSDDERRGPRP